MKRLVRSGGRKGRLEWTAAQDGAVAFGLSWESEGEVRRQAEVVQVEPGIYSVLMEERSYEVKVTPTQRSWAVDVDGRHFVIACEDPRVARRAAAEGHNGTGPLPLTAPMPGKVVRVLVEAGAEIALGQGVLIVEAMKMQNEVKATRAGRVKSMLVKAGDAVAAGETLAILE